MLLSRAANRRREIAIRLSIGASRGRLVRQLLSESLLLALAASAVGLAIGLAGTRVVAQSLLPTLDVSLTPSVVLFSVAVAALAAVAFGLLPALHATSGSLSGALTAASGAIAGGRSRLQSTFVVAQVALSLVLLSTAAMFLDGLYRATRVDLGFAADAHTLAASLALPAARYDSSASSALVNSVTARLAATPGIVSAAAATAVPLGERRILAQIALTTGAADRALPATYENDVTPSFFAALDLPLVSGTVFDAGDASAAVVSQDFARRVWPNEDPLGKLVSVSGPKGPFLRVVGVARTALVYGAGEQSRPVVYRALSGKAAARQVTFIVRGSGDGNALAPALRQVIREADPSLALFGVETLAQYRADRLQPVTYGSTVLLIVGALGALLACLGVFAVVAFSVSTRAREIGVRMALGANQRNVVRLFVSEGMRLAGIGIAVGLALSTALGVAVRSAFTGVSPNQLSSFAATGAVIVIVTGLATWLPARRAATIDPMMALRSD
jgi:predicted permease